ncbi:MAG: CHAT domain-containing protein [Spirochaetia bacterium]|nr:CHAT domain-containing protein [Spirochaetia bacterium]
MGASVFESLNAELSADRIDVQFMAGRTITKLALLNALKDRDIIHFAGHLFFSEDTKESGWLLSDGKVLRAREIEKAGYAPDLVFSNSCFIGPGQTPIDQEKPVSRFNDMAGAFLAAGIYNYIGTNWEIKDSSYTLDFALNFYRAIFEEKSVGEALFEARALARKNYPASDMTWANYVLNGNPMTRIYRSARRQTFDASRNMHTAERIVSRFPLPVAQAYAAFKASESADGATKLTALVRVLEATVKTTAAYVLGNFRFLNRKLETRYAPAPLSEWLDRIYETHSTMRSAQMELAQTGVVEGLLLHRDNLEKLMTWRNALQQDSLSDEALETYVVTFQYLLENLLVDMASLSRGQFILVDQSGETGYVLQGTKPWVIAMGRGEFREKSLREKIMAQAGRVCFYSSARQNLFSLEGLMEAEERGRIVRFPPMDTPVREVPLAGHKV